MSISASSLMDTLFYSHSKARKLEEWNLICPVSHETLSEAVSLSPCRHLINQKVAQKIFDMENSEAGEFLGHCPECRVKVLSYREEPLVRSVVKRVFQDDPSESLLKSPTTVDCLPLSWSSSEDRSTSLHGSPPFISSLGSNEAGKSEELKESLLSDIINRGCFRAKQELSETMEREAFLDLIERHSLGISYLEIPKSLRKEFSDNDIVFLVLNLPELKGLNLQGCTDLTGEGLRVLSEFNSLMVLSLENCEQLGDEALEILSNGSNLARLDISGCKKITDKAFGSIAAIQSLKHLSCRNLPLVKGTQLSQLSGEGHPEIHSLDLSDCAQVGDGAIALLKDFSSLESLHLIGLKSLSNAALESLQGLPELKDLRLGGANIDDAGLEYLANFPTLTSLGLRNCSKVNASKLEENLLCKIPQLHRLYFDNEELSKIAKEKQEERYLNLAARMLNDQASEVINQEIPHKDKGDFIEQVQRLDAEISLVTEASKVLKLAVALIGHPNHTLNLTTLEVFKLPELLRNKAELHIRQVELLEEDAWEGKVKLYEEAMACFEKSLEEPTDTKWIEKLQGQERMKAQRRSTLERLQLSKMEVHRQRDLLESDPSHHYKNRRFSISITVAAPLSCCQYAKDYKKSENYDEALKYFYVALEKGLLIGKEHDCYTHMAEIFLKKGMDFAAEKLLLKVLETSEELGFPIDPDVYLHLAKTYKSLFEKYPDFTHIRVKSVSYFQKMLHRARPNCPSIIEAQEALKDLTLKMSIEF